jgi:hypothetical protein
VQCTRCQQVFSSNGHQVSRAQATATVAPGPGAPVVAAGVDAPRPVARRLMSFAADAHPTGARISGNPLRAPPQRAWLERAEPDHLTPVAWVLGGSRVTVGRDASSDVVIPDLTARPHDLVLHHEGASRWRVERTIELGTSEPLVNHQRLLIGMTWLGFSSSGALAVRSHAIALDQTPLDEHAWLVWADQLKEQGDPLGDFLCERRHSDPELAEQLGALEPLHRHGAVGVTWNRFGFLSELRLSLDVLRRHRFVVDVAWVPGVRHLATLTLTGQVDVDELAAVLGSCRLPRALQALRLERGSPPGWLVASVQQQCPFLAGA